MQILLLGFCLLVAQCQGFDSPEEGDLFEGDIVLDPEDDINDVYNAIKNVQMQWPNGKVPYTVDPSASSRELDTLKAAIADYNKYTCIRWVPRTTETAYVSIVKGRGCSSAVGTRGRSSQRLTLGGGCWNKGIIIHEMMHAIGFWHEQSRTDRDNYVTIVYENIQQGRSHNFNKQSPTRVTDISTYDYGSVMHYRGTAFSKNRKPTIVAKQEGVTLGQRKGFSTLDILKVNTLYKCKDAKTAPTVRTTPGIKTTPRPRPTSTVCSDKSLNCALYKRRGYCGRQIYLQMCQKTCGKCSGVTPRLTPRPTSRPTPAICRDKSLNCALYKRNGYCGRQIYLQMCQKTCGACSGVTPRLTPRPTPRPTPASCIDRSTSCPVYKQRGFCARLYYKNTLCRKTCTSCGASAVTTSRTTPSTRPTTPRPTGPTVKPSSLTCGVSRLGHDKYIVGGQEAKVGRWPWMADLMYNGRHSCGGSVLNANWILTAAHCVLSKPASTLTIRVGWHDQMRRTQNGVEHKVKKVVGHKMYKKTPGVNHDNDIALLELATPIDFRNEHVNIACLPQKDEVFNGECMATGWGLTQGTGDKTKLREVSVPLYTTSACNKYWGGRVSDRQICMGTVPPVKTRSACRGDSGGPLVCKKNGRWIQAGLTSWGTFQCTGKPAVYTRLSSYLDWINQNMK